MEVIEKLCHEKLYVFKNLRVFHFLMILSILFTELKEFKEVASKN